MLWTLRFFGVPRAVAASFLQQYKSYVKPIHARHYGVIRWQRKNEINKTSEWIIKISIRYTQLLCSSKVYIEYTHFLSMQPKSEGNHQPATLLIISYITLSIGIILSLSTLLHPSDIQWWVVFPLTLPPSTSFLSWQQPAKYYGLLLPPGWLASRHRCRRCSPL
jgi:hypothetical protein